jgi:hypothetical protein
MGKVLLGGLLQKGVIYTNEWRTGLYTLIRSAKTLKIKYNLEYYFT